MLQEFSKYFNQLNKNFVPSFSPNMGMVGGMTNIDSDGDPNEIEFKDSKGLKSGKYSKDTIQKLVAASKALGVDPYQTIAIGLQESGLGTNIKRNSHTRARKETSIGTVHTGDLFDDNDLKTIDQLKAKGFDENSLQLALALKKKLAYAKQLGFNNEDAMLQAYNGYGTITPKQFGGATTAYGVDISNGVDLRKNPLYGKRVLQLKNDLMANKDLQSLIK